MILMDPFQFGIFYDSILAKKKKDASFMFAVNM